jgi:hypothetical protein
MLACILLILQSSGRLFHDLPFQKQAMLLAQFELALHEEIEYKSIDRLAPFTLVRFE